MIEPGAVHQAFGRELAPLEKFDGAVGAIQKLRRFVAPPGSLREKMLRRLYAPMLTSLQTNPFDPDRPPPTMHAELLTFQSVGMVDFRRSPVGRIIVLKLDHIGDMIIGMRAMRQLREGFESAHITLVCASWNADLARKLEIFDEIVCFDFFPPMHRDWAGLKQSSDPIYDAINGLPLGAYDLAIDLRHDADTRPFLYRIRARYRAGFSAPVEPDQPALDLVLPVAEGFPVAYEILHSLHADVRLQLLTTAVIATFAQQTPHPIRSLLANPEAIPRRRCAILAIGAGDPIRAWPIDRYAEVARALHKDYGLDIVVLGGKAEQQDAEELERLLAPLPVETVIGMAIDKIPDFIAAATLCICNGSGISHMAAALGVPTVCILGGTTRMEVWHPSGPKAVSIGGKTLCQPCGKQYASQCPWQVACLSIVKPRNVMDLCEKLLRIDALADHRVTSNEA